MEPRKRPRIFSHRTGETQRAVKFNATNYFNNTDNNDDFLFNEPLAPVSSISSSNQTHGSGSSTSHSTNSSSSNNRAGSSGSSSGSTHKTNQHTYTRSTTSSHDSFASPSSDSRIRKAHQCHESGELTDFDANIEFYLDSIGNTNSNSARCLSLLGLASLATSPDFRMHLRAHENMPRIIAALKDAPNDASLALSCATLMFIHNQDRMTLDIDPQALQLMLRLLETRSDGTNGTVDKKVTDKVKGLCEQMKSKGHAKYLNLDEITAGELATETLLGLTSKRAGDWFKEELRNLKGIDYLLDIIVGALENEDLDTNDSQLNKIDRCMHVLENVTFQNTKNQEYIIAYKNNALIEACPTLFGMCKLQILCSVDKDKTARFTSTLLSALKVLNNMTSENENASKAIATQTDLIHLLLDCATGLQTELLSEQRSDFMMIILCLLVNIVEFSPKARRMILYQTCEDRGKCAIDTLIDDFYERIEAAHQTENQADQLLDPHKMQKLTEAMQDSIINQVITKSGKHMEHCIIAACYALLFGCIVQDNDEFKEKLSSKLENESFVPLIDVLQKLHDFAHLADIMTNTGVTRVKRILKILKNF